MCDSRAVSFVGRRSLGGVEAGSIELATGAVQVRAAVVSVRQLVTVAVAGGLLVVGLGSPVVAAPAMTSAGTAAVGPAPAASHADTFRPVGPHRILDTRSAKPVGAASTTRVHVAGSSGVPAVGVSVVVVTVTVASATAGGYLTVFADGTTRPATSNVNFAAGQTVADQVYAPVGTDGSIAVYNNSRGSVQLIVDVSGYFATQEGQPAGGFVSLPATRAVDTRTGLGGHVIAARSTLRWPVLGHGPIPASGVSAVAFTLTAVAPAARGYLTAYPNPSDKPPTSNVNFAAHQTVANLAVIAVGWDGDIAVYNGSSGTTQVIADIAGYFTNGNAVVAGAFVPTPGTRTLNAKAERGGADFAAPTLGTAPSTAVLNVSVSSPTANGYAIVYPADAVRPIASTLNFSAGNSASGMAVARTDGATRPLIHNGSSGTAHFAVDQFGYYLGGPDLGSISGTADDAVTGKAVAGVRVVAFQSDPDGEDSDWFQYGTTSTAADGTYQVSGLLGGQQYWICFDTRSTAGTGPFTGYAAQCYRRVAWSTPGFFNDDPGATLISVADGSAITGIDASLTPIRVGGLAGTVTAANGSAISAVSVTATQTDSGFVISTATDNAGDYTVPILPPGNYTVCFHATAAPTALAPYGYLDRCVAAAVAAGSVTRADVTLVAGGGIAGRVTTVSGAKILFGGVQAFARFGAHTVYSAMLNADGTYTVGGLAPGPYSVCFDGGGPELNPPYGFVDECYRDVVWDGRAGAGPPAGTTAVTATAGATRAGVDATLASAGAISGTLTTATGAKLVRVSVYVLDNSTGHPVDVRATQTDYSGTYSIVGLSPSTQYTVCFNGDDAGDPPNQGYASQCWRGVPWSGSLTTVPSGLSPVVVTNGANHTGVDASLTKR